MDEEIKTPENGAGEGKPDVQEFKVSKEEYDRFKANEATLGSLKRELKDLKKAKETETPETPQTKTEEFGLLQKTFLRAASIVDEDEVELAKDIQKKTGVDWDKLVDDDYFQMKLKKLRDGKANAAALDVRGGSAPSSGAKNSSEHWIQKGTPPTPKDIPGDRKTRAKIIREMLGNQKSSGGTYYNE